MIRTPTNNKLRMEDKRGEEHIKLSTEYGGKTQLNTGHNVNAQRELRGEGAELRTDKWVSIRGGAGVFISADKQPSAGDRMLAMEEAIAQLENAPGIAKSPASAAESAQALPSDTGNQQTLNDALKELAQPGIVLNAPQGVSISSPQAVRLSSGSASVGIVSQQNTDISALKRFTVAAGEAVSLLARKAGMKLFAAKERLKSGRRMMRWRRRRKGYHRDQRGRASGNHGGGGTGGELCGSVYQAKWWQYRAGLPREYSAEIGQCAENGRS